MSLKLLLIGDNNNTIQPILSQYQNQIMSPNLFAKLITAVWVKERILYPHILDKEDFNSVQVERYYSYSNAFNGRNRSFLA